MPPKKQPKGVCVYIRPKCDRMTTSLTNEPTRNCLLQQCALMLVLVVVSWLSNVSDCFTHTRTSSPGQSRNPQQAGVEGFELSSVDVGWASCVALFFDERSQSLRAGNG